MELNSGSINWYDVVVVAALFYGVLSGIRAGLTGEIIRVIGLVLMVILALEFHEPVGDWLSANSPFPDEAAQLIAFVSIALVVYLITVAIRLRTKKRMQELKVGSLVEHMGGGFAGMIRMLVVMALVTLLLNMSTSGFLADQVGVRSRFGSLVLEQLPAMRAVEERNLPQKDWVLPNSKRVTEPKPEASDATNAQHSDTIGK